MTLNKPSSKQITLRWPEWFWREVRKVAFDREQPIGTIINELLSREFGIPMPPRPTVAAKPTKKAKGAR